MVLRDSVMFTMVPSKGMDGVRKHHVRTESSAATGADESSACGAAECGGRRRGIHDPTDQRVGRDRTGGRRPGSGLRSQAAVLAERAVTDAGGHRCRVARRRVRGRGEAKDLCGVLSDHHR